MQTFFFVFFASERRAGWVKWVSWHCFKQRVLIAGLNIVLGLDHLKVDCFWIGLNAPSNAPPPPFLFAEGQIPDACFTIKSEHWVGAQFARPLRAATEKTHVLQDSMVKHLVTLFLETFWDLSTSIAASFAWLWCYVYKYIWRDSFQKFKAHDLSTSPDKLGWKSLCRCLSIDADGKRRFLGGVTKTLPSAKGLRSHGDEEFGGTMHVCYDI